jgi:hypothetical protein
MSTDDTMPYSEVIDDASLFRATETRSIETSHRSGRHQHVVPVALVTRNPSQIKIRSDQLTYRLLLGLLDGKHYTKHQLPLLAEYSQILPRGRVLSF